MKKIHIRQISGIPENLEEIISQMQEKITALETSNAELRKAVLGSLSEEEIKTISSSAFSSDSGMA